MFGIYKNEQILTPLFRAIKNQTVAGCYIIEGADGSGKMSVARLAAAYLVCEHPNSDGPCLQCRACKNALSGNHVDVCEYSPEEGKKIPVDAIRELLKKAFVVPSEANYRVFIIRHSEMMKKEAQNALLKSIEEPGKNTVFFLLTNDKSLLLPTVRSRAVKLTTSHLKNSEIVEILKSRGINADENLLPLNVGSVGNAEKVLQSDSFISKKKLIMKYFSLVLEGGTFSQLSTVLSPQEIKRNDFSEILCIIKDATHDIIMRCYSKSSVPCFFTDEAFLDDLSAVIKPLNALALFDLAEDLLVANQSNVNIFSSVAQINLAAKKLIDY